MWWHQIRMPVNVARLRHDGGPATFASSYICSTTRTACASQLNGGQRARSSGTGEGGEAIGRDRAARAREAGTWGGVTCSPIAHMRAVASRPCPFLDTHRTASITSPELVRREQGRWQCRSGAYLIKLLRASRPAASQRPLVAHARTGQDGFWPARA